LSVSRTLHALQLILITEPVTLQPSARIMAAQHLERVLLDSVFVVFVSRFLKSSSLILLRYIITILTVLISI